MGSDPSGSLVSIYAECIGRLVMKDDLLNRHSLTALIVVECEIVGMSVSMRVRAY